MRRPTVFLVTGYARAGKDTVSAAIAELLGCEVLSFADTLKDAVNRYFTALGIESVDMHYTPDKVRFRDLLVAAGRAARSVDANVFADHVALDCHLALMRGKSVVVSDWRYANEHQRILAKVGPARLVTIHVSRSGTGPANQEEQDSIEALLGSCPIDHRGTFKDGAVGELIDWAKDVALQHSIEIPAA